MSSKIIKIKILNLEGPYNSFGNTFIEGINFFFLLFTREIWAMAFYVFDTSEQSCMINAV